MSHCVIHIEDVSSFYIFLLNVLGKYEHEIPWICVNRKRALDWFTLFGVCLI